MFEWIFRPDTLWDKILHLGFGGFILAIVAKNAIGQITPSPGATSFVCFAFSLLLAIPALIGNSPSKDPILRWPTLALAVAYAWMSLLYFFNWTHLWTHLLNLSAGYDAVTDLIGTLFFVVAWYMVSAGETDKQSQVAERIALALLCLVVLAAGVSKLLVDAGVGGSLADGQAARLILNICNGAIFLSLYGQMRRLFPSPDPVTHIVVVLYGCAQIAAQGRDCLSTSVPCAPPALEGLVALAIAWTLLLGKVAFGAYVSYIYFNGRIGWSDGTYKA